MNLLQLGRLLGRAPGSDLSQYGPLVPADTGPDWLADPLADVRAKIGAPVTPEAIAPPGVVLPQATPVGGPPKDTVATQQEFDALRKAGMSNREIYERYTLAPGVRLTA